MLLKSTEEAIQPIAAEETFSRIVMPVDKAALAHHLLGIEKPPKTAVRAVVAVVTHHKQFPLRNRDGAEVADACSTERIAVFPFKKKKDSKKRK